MESGHRRRDEWTVSRDRWRVDTVGGTSGLCLGTWPNGVKFERCVIPPSTLPWNISDDEPDGLPCNVSDDEHFHSPL